VKIGGPDLEARIAKRDLYKSIDAMVSKLDRQLGDDHKTKQGRRKTRIPIN
jgi:ribosome-associated translation inhibitor RaiA